MSRMNRVRGVTIQGHSGRGQGHYGPDLIRLAWPSFRQKKGSKGLRWWLSLELCLREYLPDMLVLFSYISYIK